MRIQLDVVRGRSAPQTLVVNAATPEEARLHLQAQGYIVLSAAHASMPLAGWAQRWRQPPRSASRRELVLFIEQLHALLQAGLSVIEALDTLSKGASARWHTTLVHITEKLRQGLPLSQALAQLSVFPPLLIAMVGSAELTSDLPQALTRFLEHEQKAEQVRHQLISVALYPALLLTVGSGVLAFLLLYVMPRFSRIFESMHDLPWSAQAMVAWAHLLKAHGTELLGIFAILALGLASVFSVPAYRARVASRMLKMRPWARYFRVYFLARWYRTTGMLVQGGIPLPESILLAHQVLPEGLKAGGLAVEHAMRQGLSPSQAYLSHEMATPVAEQLLRAGERSGDVGLMLKRAAEFHETEVTKSLDNAMRVIEPLVMTIIGLGVGVVVVLMYLPIFELASAIQ